LKPASKTRKLPVLVIEDEPSVMAFVRSALEREGYAVAQVRSGREAIELLKISEFSGIISDMRTPGGVGGAEVREWVLGNRAELANKILFTTGDTANEDTATILKSSGVPYLEKPFRVQQLLAMVTRILGRPE